MGPKGPSGFPTRFTQTTGKKKLLLPLKWQRSVFQHVRRHTKDKWIIIPQNKNEIDQKNICMPASTCDIVGKKKSSFIDLQEIY